MHEQIQRLFTIIIPGGQMEFVIPRIRDWEDLGKEKFHSGMFFEHNKCPAKRQFGLIQEANGLLSISRRQHSSTGGQGQV
jgi:hypothetical protein